MRPGTGIRDRHLGDIAALVELVLGESAGRVRAGAWSSCRVMAVIIPVRRDGEARAPRDRRHRLKVRAVELISGRPVQAFDPPLDMGRQERQRARSDNHALARQYASVPVQKLGILVGREMGILHTTTVRREDLGIASVRPADGSYA
jgi:hypothetical protein